MIGAILGDIIGSIYEFNPIKTKDFDLIDPMRNHVTDDTLMTMAIGKAVMEAKNDFELLSRKAQAYMLDIGQRYPSGYGGMFKEWLKSDDPKPYGSYGNGAAMRVSACGIAYDTIEDVYLCADAVTAVTHNHPEGMKAARATAEAVFMAKKGHSKIEIRKAMSTYYNMYTNLDEIRPRYRFTEDAKYTVPQAIISFLESTDFEDAIRNAVSLGGDADTLAAIAGSIAAEYYGVPKSLMDMVDEHLVKEELIGLLRGFQELYPQKREADNMKDRPLIFHRKR